MQIVSEINDIEDLTESNLPINLNHIDQYERKNPSLLAKYEMGTYQKGSFCGGSNIKLILITCKDKLVLM